MRLSGDGGGLGRVGRGCVGCDWKMGGTVLELEEVALGSQSVNRCRSFIRSLIRLTARFSLLSFPAEGGGVVGGTGAAAGGGRRVGRGDSGSGRADRWGRTHTSHTHALQLAGVFVLVTVFHSNALRHNWNSQTTLFSVEFVSRFPADSRFHGCTFPWLQTPAKSRRRSDRR